MSFIEVPPGATSRRFVQSASVLEITSSPSGGGTYQVDLSVTGYGSLTVATGLSQASADEKAEEIATAAGLDWQLS